VLDQPRAADYAIWLVALALYVADAARLLTPRQLLVVEARRGRLAAVFSAEPFTVAGRALVFTPLLFPYRGAFVAPWGRPWSAAATLSAALASIASLRGVLRPARVLAAWSFLLLFVIGPVLTLTLGTDPAVLCVAALLYPTVLMTIAVLWWRRNAWRLSRGAAALLSLEILVCPAFLPNLVRKVTAAHAIEVDGAQLVVAAAAEDVKQEFLGRLASRAEVLINEAADDAEGQAALRSYLAVVRAAQ
jgi:hypothetical protein